jgi:hypothetical protein
MRTAADDAIPVQTVAVAGPFNGPLADLAPGAPDCTAESVHRCAGPSQCAARQVPSGITPARGQGDPVSSSSTALAALRRGGREAKRCAHKSDVRKRLGKVSGEPLGANVIFLREQPEIVCHCKDTFEGLPRGLTAALQQPALRQPATAGKECALLGLVWWASAMNQAVHIQLSLDGIDGARNPIVADRQESDQRQKQQAGIK